LPAEELLQLNQHDIHVRSFPESTTDASLNRGKVRDRYTIVVTAA
jgi:hypothetical protein